MEKRRGFGWAEEDGDGTTVASAESVGEGGHCRAGLSEPELAEAAVIHERQSAVGWGRPGEMW